MGGRCRVDEGNDDIGCLLPLQIKFVAGRKCFKFLLRRETRETLS